MDAKAHGVAVARAPLGGPRRHREVEEDDAPPRPFSEQVELGLGAYDLDVGRDTARGCPDAVAQAQQGQALHTRREEGQRLVAANPLMRRHGLGAHVLVSVGRERAHGPLHGLLERGAPRQPVPDAVTQPGELAIRGVVRACQRPERTHDLRRARALDTTLGPRRVGERGRAQHQDHREEAESEAYVGSAGRKRR